MSLGQSSAYKYNPISILGEKLVARGMAVIAAACNDGSDGVWMVCDTGLGDLATSVASFDNAYGIYHSFTYGSSVSYPYSPSASWGKVINLPASATLVPIFEQGGSLSDGCEDTIYNGVDVKGKVVLAIGDLSRCDSVKRGEHAQKAGAAALLVQTTPMGLGKLNGNASFPMASIENKAGDDLIAAWKKSHSTKFTWSKSVSNFLVEGGGGPSYFSSRGLDGELRSKPDIAAP
ncbi:hypothetical protein BGZ65_013013, partial [Modicella reniformis]